MKPNTVSHKIISTKFLAWPYLPKTTDIVIAENRKAKFESNFFFFLKHDCYITLTLVCENNLLTVCTFVCTMCALQFVAYVTEYSIVLGPSRFCLPNDIPIR